MFHIDKFQNLGPIAHMLQHLGPDRVRVQRGHPLLDQPVLEHRSHQLVFHLSVQLVLAAGHRQNHLCAPTHGLGQGVIRGRIAGVQGHHHVHLIHALVARDIPAGKAQPLVAVGPRQLLTVGDHILL